MPAPGDGATRAGVPMKIVSVDETPKAYGSCARCKARRSVALSPNSASPSTAVTVIPLARTCRSKVSASCHFGCPRTPAGMRARVRCAGVNHDSGRYNVAPSIHARAPVHNATVTAVWQLAILPSAPQVLPRHADRVGPLLRKARAVENEDARAIGNRRAQVAPHGVGRPRRIGDEMLERLIGARIADALQHRAHRLAAAVAQQPEQIAAKRAALGHVREADLERLEPFAQAVEPRRRIARQSRQHRNAAYRTREKSTSSKCLVCADSRTNLLI